MGKVQAAGRCRQIEPFLSHDRMKGLGGDQDPVFFFKGQVTAFPLVVAPQDQVDRRGTGFPVERNGIGVSAFSKHVLLLDAGHPYDGTIPGNEPAIGIDDPGGVGQEFDDVGQQSLGIGQGFFGLLALGDVTSYSKDLNRFSALITSKAIADLRPHSGAGLKVGANSPGVLWDRAPAPSAGWTIITNWPPRSTRSSIPDRWFQYFGSSEETLP